jgi:hypothetical protein
VKGCLEHSRFGNNTFGLVVLVGSRGRSGIYLASCSSGNQRQSGLMELALKTSLDSNCKGNSLRGGDVAWQRTPGVRLWSVLCSGRNY